MTYEQRGNLDHQRRIDQFDNDLGGDRPASAKALREQRGEAAFSIKRLAATAIGEFRDFTTPERAEWTEANALYDALTRDIATREKGTFTGHIYQGHRGMTSYRGTDTTDTGNDLDSALAAWVRNHSGIPLNGDEFDACERYGIHPSSGTFSIRFGTSTPRTARELFGAGVEKRAMSIVPNTGGGYTVPQGFMPALEQALLHSSGILQACEIMRTEDGRPMPWPITDTDNEGALVGENQEVTEQDPTFGAVIFGSYKLTSKLVRIPHELMRDTGVDLARELGTMLGSRIGRKLNRLCTVGTGAGQPEGIVPGSTLGVTAVSATAIAFDELIDLLHSVDVAYRTVESGFGFMMHDSIAATIRKLKDGDGQYIWQQSTQLGQPDRLLGWPVFLNNHMAAAAVSGAKTVLAGAFKKYKVRLVAELRLRRLVERYAEFDQEGFLAFQEFDAHLLDAGTNPVKYLTH